MAGRADSKLQRRRVPSAKRKRILQCRRKESAMKKLETRSMNEVADAPSAVAYSDVQRMIVHVRNQQVIIDADVAKLYGVETKRINEAVRNNPDKFPADYMFALTADELSDLRSKFSSANISPKSRALPKAFTEKGLYMLATVLKSRRATEATFAIIETFAKVRYLKRELVELHTEADKQKRGEKMRHFGEALTDIVMPDLDTVETESSLELNFFIGKLKHSVRRIKRANSKEQD
jgi:hypothetical protein